MFHLHFCNEEVFFIKNNPEAIFNEEWPWGDDYAGARRMCKAELDPDESDMQVYELDKCIKDVIDWPAVDGRLPVLKRVAHKYFVPLCEQNTAAHGYRGVVS